MEPIINFKLGEEFQPSPKSSQILPNPPKSSQILPKVRPSQFNYQISTGFSVLFRTLFHPVKGEFRIGVVVLLYGRRIAQPFVNSLLIRCENYPTWQPYFVITQSFLEGFEVKAKFICQCEK